VLNLKQGGDPMKYYEQLVDKRIFSYQDLIEIAGSNRNTISSLVLRYLQKGYIEQVRKNLYVAISMETGTSIANRFEIGCHVLKDGYISHHAAFEYYGLTNQMMYQVQVSGNKRFRTFSYDGYEFHCFSERIADGVVQKENGIRVTDYERTVLDSINDIEKAGGLSELFKCLQMIPYLDEEKFIAYLDKYDKQFLYQKTGFLLEHLKDMLKLSDTFFEICHDKMKKSLRYFSSDTDRETMEYCPEWNLYIPKDFKRIAELEE